MGVVTNYAHESSDESLIGASATTTAGRRARPLRNLFAITAIVAERAAVPREVLHRAVCLGCTDCLDEELSARPITKVCAGRQCSGQGTPMARRAAGQH